VAPAPAATQTQATGIVSPLEQVRAAAGALLREQKVDEAFELVLSAMDAVLQKSRELELLVAKLRRERLGQSSERVNAAQLALLFEELQRQGDTTAVVDAAAEDRDDATVNEEIQASEDARRDAAKEIASKQRKGRLTLPGAERQVHEVELSEDERRCAQCGEARQKIGEEIARRIEYIPGHFVHHEHRLSKYACANCREGVVTAPGPQRILERSIADASVLAHVVVSKYVDHTPLHRLHESYARTGASIPVSTLSDWTGGAANLLEPLVRRLEQRVLSAHVVRTDATGLKVLDPRTPANIQGERSGCTSATSTTSSSAMRNPATARAVPGSFSQGAPDRSRPTARVSSTVSSTGVWRVLSRSAASRTRGASSWRSKTRTAEWRIRSG
jgi:transposase